MTAPEATLDPSFGKTRGNGRHLLAACDPLPGSYSFFCHQIRTSLISQHERINCDHVITLSPSPSHGKGPGHHLEATKSGSLHPGLCSLS